MSGHRRARSRSQSYRALRRKWRAGWRPVVNFLPVLSKSTYQKIEKVTLSLDLSVVQFEGKDADGKDVREDILTEPIYAKTFDDVLEARGMKRLTNSVFKLVHSISFPEIAKVICAGCKSQIDENVCWCGSTSEEHVLSTCSFVPMGCDCIRVPEVGVDLATIEAAFKGDENSINELAAAFAVPAKYLFPENSSYLSLKSSEPTELTGIAHDRIESPTNGDLVCLPSCGACEAAREEAVVCQCPPPGSPHYGDPNAVCEYCFYRSKT